MKNYKGTELTLDSAFELLIEYLKGERPYGYENGDCKYRTSEGNACLVGSFIRDEDYDDGLDETSLKKVVDSCVKTDLYNATLLALQGIHDRMSLGGFGYALKSLNRLDVPKGENYRLFKKLLIEKVEHNDSNLS